MDVQILLANTYHLFLRPGHELIRAHGGLHRFMSWPGAILTDSGGFQVFSLDTLRKVTDEGVLFRSHLNGDAHLFTPESTVDVQLALGSDIVMVLDECLAYPASHEAAAASMRRTVRWAEAAFAHYRGAIEGVETRHALFPIVQGSMYADLRRECAARLLELDAEGYAIGGLSVGEPRELSLEMVEATAPLLPPDRPRYVMGVGMPGGIAAVRGARRGHDGLRAAVAQRAQRVPVHRTRARHYQAGALSRRPAAAGRGLLLLHLPRIIRAPTCGTCSRRARSSTPPWPPSTTCGTTLTSWRGSGSL